PDLGPDLMVCSNEFAHLTPGAFSGYTWSTGAHSSYLNVDTAGHGLGTFVYWVNVANSFGCTNKDTILVTFDPCTGIDPIFSKQGTISVFPNPFSSEFTIVSEEGSDVLIYDMKGTLV